MIFRNLIKLPSQFQTQYFENYKAVKETRWCEYHFMKKIDCDFYTPQGKNCIKQNKSPHPL